MGRIRTPSIAERHDLLLLVRDRPAAPSACTVDLADVLERPVAAFLRLGRRPSKGWVGDCASDLLLVRSTCSAPDKAAHGRFLASSVQVRRDDALELVLSVLNRIGTAIAGPTAGGRLVRHQGQLLFGNVLDRPHRL